MYTGTNHYQEAFRKPHMQLNRTQYTALYRLARLNKYSFIPDYMQRGVTRAYDKLTTIDLPIGCFYFVEASYRSMPADALAVKLARSMQPDSEAHETLYRALYRLGQAHERAILFARSTHEPTDFDPAIRADKMIDALAKSNQDVMCYWHVVNGQNSIRIARNLEPLNY